MSGLFGCLAHSTQECLDLVFYGTDYHSHLGTASAGVAFCQHRGGFLREIHNIHDGAQFKHVFARDFEQIAQTANKNVKTIKFGLGVISDRDPQPLCYGTKFGNIAIATVGRIPNLNVLAKELELVSPMALREEGRVNIAEVVMALITQKDDLIEGINHMWSKITGSITMILLIGDGRMIGVRDRFGVSSLALGKAEVGIRAFASETSSFANLGFTSYRFLKPGEIVQVSESDEIVLTPGCQKNCRACAFNWIYTGDPAASYENIEVEPVRYRCGQALARRNQVDIDMVAGIPDSGTAHAIGYAHESGDPFGRPLTKYTSTWSRSYTPSFQGDRDRIAQMKLLPIPSLITGKRLLFCDDSIVRGTQLRQRTELLYRLGVNEVHVRPACPPLLFPCPYLRATRTFDELVARRAIIAIEGSMVDDISAYLDPESGKFAQMIDFIAKEVGATSLAYLRLEDMIEAIGLPENQLCTYCWTGNPIDRYGLEIALIS